MRHIPFIGLLLAIALAPLPLGSNRPGPWSFLAIWVGLLLVGWAILLWRDWTRLNVRPAFWRGPAIAFAAVIAWGFVQAAGWTPAFLHHWTWRESAELAGLSVGGAISATPMDSLTGLTRLLTYAGVFFLSMQWCRQHGAARAMLATVAVSATAYAVYGLLVTFSGNQTILWFQKWAYPDSLTATFVNRNSFAAYCGIALVVLAGGVLSRLRSSRIALLGPDAGSGDRQIAVLALQAAAILIVLTALFLTQSRGGLAAGLVGLAVLAVLQFAPSGGDGRRGLVRLWPVLVLALLVIVALLSGGAMLDRLGEGQAMTGRAAIWGRSLAALADAPLFGHGLGSFGTIFSAYQDEQHVFAYPVDKAHNTYLEVLVELGLPFGLLLIALPFWLNWRILRGRSLGQGGRFADIALASSAVLAAHSLVDFSAQIPAIVLVWMALLGAGFAQSLPQGVSAMSFVRSAEPAETMNRSGSGR